MKIQYHGGLVITDGTNEFVWIPASKFEYTYSHEDTREGYESWTLLEPSYVRYDTHVYINENAIDINNYYGPDYYNLEKDFDLETHYKEMVDSINKYGGFYFGRYETTITENKEIGSKYNEAVLRANTRIKEGTNAADNNNPYYYRWWGLYDAQRNSNVLGNGDYVQTNMLWGQQWNELIKFLGSETIENLPRIHLTYLNSGQCEYNGSKDIVKNIYDLRRNLCELSAESVHNGNYTAYRVSHGGNFEMKTPGDINEYCHWIPQDCYESFGSRLTLYIK